MVYLNLLLHGAVSWKETRADVECLLCPLMVPLPNKHGNIGGVSVVTSISSRVRIFVFVAFLR